MRSGASRQPSVRAAGAALRLPRGLGWALLLAGLLGAFRIGRLPLGQDEAFSFGLVSQGWATMWRYVAAHEANMVAYHVLLKAWSRLADGEGFLRGLSLLFAVGTIPVQYFLARRLCGPRVAMGASLLLAAHVFVVRYAQEARAYSMALFFAALSALLLLRALERPSSGRWLAYVLAGVALVHAHILGGLILAGHAVAVLLLQPAASFRRAALGFLGIGVLSAPLLSFFVRHRNAGNISWIPPLSVEQVLHVLYDLCGMGGMPAVYLLGVGLVIAAGRRHESGRGAATAALWLVVPVGLLMAASLLLRPMFQAAYLIGILPALTILTACGLARLEGWRRDAAVLAGVVGTAGSLAWWYLGDHKEDWRAVVAHVAAQGQPGDGLVALPPYLRSPIDYYLLRAGDAAQKLAPVYPAIPWGQTGNVALIDREYDPARLQPTELARRGWRRLWVLTPCGVHVPDPRTPALLAELAKQGYTVRQQAFYQVDVRLVEHIGQTGQTGQTAAGGGR